MEGIQIFINKIGAQRDIALITVKGLIDVNTSPELVKAINSVLKDDHNQLIVDLGNVSYISSAGWGVFVGEIKGIRERGGDLKLVHMTPEVQQVFEMLEFHRIIRHYDTIEEAVNEFDLLRGWDIAKGRWGETTEVISKEILPSSKVPSGEPRPGRESFKFRTHQRKPKIDEATLPLSEKIKLIIIENPLLNSWGIWKTLRSERFGRTKISWFRLRSLLKQLDLDSKAKRYRFYRSR